MLTVDRREWLWSPYRREQVPVGRSRSLSLDSDSASYPFLRLWNLMMPIFYSSMEGFDIHQESQGSVIRYMSMRWSILFESWKFPENALTFGSQSYLRRRTAKPAQAVSTNQSEDLNLRYEHWFEKSPRIQFQVWTLLSAKLVLMPASDTIDKEKKPRPKNKDRRVNCLLAFFDFA